MSTNRKKAFIAKDYLAAEEGTIFKKIKGSPRVALVYPNTYYLGMSNLGFQTIYALFNQDPQTVCERVFLPDDLVSQHHQQKLPLRSLESGSLVDDFDCVAFSISFENDYLYFLNILDLASIPFFAKDREEHDPIVLAGGAAITINPEPIRAFCDVLFIGEAEESIQEIIEVLRSGKTRSQKIAALGNIEGCYVCQDMDAILLPEEPSLICEHSPDSHILEQRIPLSYLRHYKRKVPENINGFPIQTQIYTPYSEFGKLSLIEVQRGCGRGCKFCAEGFIYTPFRQRCFDLIKQQVLQGLQYRHKIGLIGADLLVYPQILELMKFIHAHGGTFSPSSVRVDALTKEIIEQLALSEHRTMAIAPEGGSDEMRKNLNKKFDNASILNVVDMLIQHGIPNIKMYFMIGLPNETKTDIDQMIDLVDQARRVVLKHAKSSGRMGSLIMSINPFIPKPRTPYQVGYFAGVDYLENTITYIKKKLLSQGGIRIYHENPFFAYVQALLSNGLFQTHEYLLEVFRQQGALKKSLKKFQLMPVQSVAVPLARMPALRQPENFFI